MDIQDLSFEFVSAWPSDKVKFIKCRSHESKVSGGLGCDVTHDIWEPTLIKEANRHAKVAILAREDVTEGAGMNSDVLHPTITFTLQVRRHSTNYLYNIIIPTAVLVSLAFTSFTVPLNEVADRASITLTLLLSIIAYKLIIKDELPKVNFLTLIDKYILVSMTIVAMISFTNSSVGNGVDEITDALKARDYDCRLVIGMIWVACNLGFVLRIMCRNAWANRRITLFKKQCCEVVDRSTDVLLLV